MAAPRRPETARRRARSRLVCVDTGGTFTDLVVRDADGIRAHKVLSTPDAPERAVLEALDRVGGPGAGGRLVHGSTVGLNSVLTGRGARVALVTNAGFEDLLEVARQDRPELYARTVPPRPVLVPRERRFGVPERRHADGRLAGPVDGRALAAVAEAVAASGAESVAVCLLHSYAWPEDEERVAAALAGLGLPLSLSSRLRPRHREYERFSTAAIDAFVKPVVSRYLGRLAEAVAPMELHLVRNEGGSMPVADVLAEPVRAIWSGPAGGAMAVRYWSRVLGHERGIGFDMGGTSADVALCGDDRDVDEASALGPFALALPVVPLASVGTGGGSLAWRDDGGALRVGPDSAGADPGPACYGKGDLPTLSDAHLVLGRLPSWGLLGGSFPLDVDRAARALDRLGREVGLPRRRLAEGLLEIADLQMARPLRRYTLGRGLDPAELPLVAFGGAGGLHACRLARLCGFRHVVVPPHQGLLSAEGMLLASEVFEREEACVLELDRAGERELGRRGRVLLRDTRAALREARRRLPRHRAEVLASLRYRGMNAEFLVRPGAGARGRFEDAFERRFGFRQRLPIEVLRLRARLVLDPGPRPELWELLASSLDEPSQGGARRPRRLGRGGLWWLERAEVPRGPSRAVPGPLAVLDYAGTTIVEAGFEVFRHRSGALVLRARGAAR
ncbi:MAG: hydantoinase/oxoprolinase family protein [Planctomycetota bacterium]